MLMLVAVIKRYRTARRYGYGMYQALSFSYHAFKVFDSKPNSSNSFLLASKMRFN